MNQFLNTFIIGIGATALTDCWAIVRRHLFGIALPNYGLVGRWITHMRHGQFHHNAIASSARMSGEHITGWTAHYVIGIAFAALLSGTYGQTWLHQPAIGPALVVGIGTVLAPFLLMQPGMGAGIAAHRTPNPNAARLQSLITHAVFGLGLYITGWVVHYFNSL